MHYAGTLYSADLPGQNINEKFLQDCVPVLGDSYTDHATSTDWPIRCCGLVWLRYFSGEVPQLHKTVPRYTTPCCTGWLCWCSGGAAQESCLY